MASSVGLPRPLEGARVLVGGGSPAALVMEFRPLAVTIPRAAPVAVTDGTDFLELAARLLPLRLRFLITSVLSDNGRVTPWSFWQREKIMLRIRIPNIRENTHKEQSTRIAQWLTLRVTSPQRRSGSFAVRALGLALSTGGGYPTNGDTARSTRSSSDNSRLARNGQPALDSNSSRCTHARAPSPLRANRADASACGRTPNHVCSRRAEPSPPRVLVDCRWDCVLR